MPLLQTAEPTPLQGTQSTEPGSQEFGTGLAESWPRKHPDTVTSPCEDTRASLILEEINTTRAASQEEEPTNCDPRDTQHTDVTPQQLELSDLAPREPAGCHCPQETETEIKIVNLTGCQEPEAASLAPHETAHQVPETADCIRPQGPKIANPAASGGVCAAVIWLMSGRTIRE